MYKVLIVDDEQIIRNGLYQLFPWERMGIGSVFTASCAREALEIARMNRPHILLTDICMPEMDGLEMTRLMLEIIPDLKVIVLTGHDDFKYAQKSCSLGVSDFILKPVDEQNLARSINLQVERIRGEIHSALRYNLLKHRSMLQKQRELEEALIRLTEKSVDPPDMAGITEELNTAGAGGYQVAVIVPEITAGSVWNQHRHLLLMSVKSFFIKLIDANNSGWTFEDRNGNIVVIFFVNAKCGAPSEQISKLQDIVGVEFDVALKIGIGPVADQIAGIRSSYDRAGENLLSGGPPDRSGGEERVQEEHLNSADRIAFYKGKILDNFHDVEIVKEYLKKFIDEIRSSGLLKSAAVEKYYDMASAFYWKYLTTTGNSVDGKLEALISTFQNSDIENCSVFLEIFIIKLAYSNRKQMHEIVIAATQYINQNLTDDLTVFTLAEQFHVARNYFSRLFKKEMGEGCNEYITRKRTERAKQLLAESNLRTYEIAEQVGYHDTNYFSLAFKKNTGLSPKEFRESLINLNIK
jgi:two-component system response regulator YesN